MGIMATIFLAAQETLPNCFTIVGALVTAGRVLLYLQFPRSLAREGVLSCKGVALSSSMAMCGLVPSISHLVRIFLMICFCLSMNSWSLGWYGLLVVSLNPYCATKFLYSCAINCFLLSKAIFSTFPYSDRIKNDRIKGRDQILTGH